MNDFFGAYKSKLKFFSNELDVSFAGTKTMSLLVIGKFPNLLGLVHVTQTHPFMGFCLISRCCQNAITWFAHFHHR